MEDAAGDAVLRNVGRRVAELRRRAGLTQEQLAERYDASLKYIQRVEAGRENLGLRSLARLALILGSDIAALFERAESPVRRGRPPLEVRASNPATTATTAPQEQVSPPAEAPVRQRRRKAPPRS